MSAWTDAVADMDSQLSHLVFAGFIRQTPVRWLTHVPRYLQGIQARIGKLAQAPNKDRQLQNEIEPLWQRCIDMFARAGQDWWREAAFNDYRWMLEEYRVSLFAQSLGTATRTSAKRLETQWEQTSRMLRRRNKSKPA